jgi:hypothetical protein
MLSTRDPLIGPFDRQKWNALLEHDALIAEIARKLRPLGQRRLDEFAAAYLALNDKRHLPAIVQKIIAQGKAEDECERRKAARARRAKIALVAGLIISGLAFSGYAIVVLRTKSGALEGIYKPFKAKHLGFDSRMDGNDHLISEEKGRAGQQADLAAAEVKTKSDELAPQASAEAKRKGDELARQASAEAKRKGDELARQATTEELEREEASCAQDLRCLGRRYLPDATVACTSLVERLANKNFEWIDEWDKPKFSNYRWENRELAVITYVGDKIKFQNDSGAWLPSTYECDFDTKTNAIVDVRVKVGELTQRSHGVEIRD